MKMADICCGIGDFAVLVKKEFQPSRLLALDHSRSSLDYARKVAADFGVTDIEYVYGDASEMILEDNSSISSPAATRCRSSTGRN